MCGNHGDPMVAKDTLDMYEWLRYNNSKLYLHMTTNGGGRSDEWWKNIAKVFGKNGRVTFSVDGLEDTNHLYRVNVDWKELKIQWTFIHKQAEKVYGCFLYLNIMNIK